MRLSHLLLPFVVLTVFAGCESAPIVLRPFPKHYYRVHVMNPRGELVSDWIAEGKVWLTAEKAYRFRAVERDTAPPHAQEIHYPYGRRMEVTGANITVSPCGTPLWLYEREGF